MLEYSAGATATQDTVIDLEFRHPPMPSNERHAKDEAARLAARRLVAMNVTELRVARQLSQVELARRSRVSEREVEDVEAGVGEMLIDTLSALADGLNVDIAFLFRDRTGDLH